MKEQLLTEIKEKIISINHYKSKLSKSNAQTRELYQNILNILEVELKTKLQEWHRMASEWLEDANSKQIVYWDGNHQDWEWDYDKERIKELSTFISEIEKIAKEQGVELK